MSKAMTKSELIQKITDRHPDLTKKEASNAMEALRRSHWNVTPAIREKYGRRTTEAAE